MKNALIIVDVQNDFCTGSLPVPHGLDIVPVINRLMGQFDVVIPTQDWHPKDHCSFAPNGPWPVHCVADSEGAALVAGLDKSRFQHVIRKGMRKEFDSYSGFYDEGGQSTGLAELLRSLGVTHVTITGLATNFCVLATALDCFEKAHFPTTVFLEGCRGIDVPGCTVADSIRTMGSKGITLIDKPRKGPDISP